MVCSPQMKRALSALCAAMMIGSGTGVTPVGGMVWAKTANVTTQAPLSITGVRITADGAGLVLDANRPFTTAESRKLSVLKFPYPYRLLLDIPNAKLGAAQTLIPVNRNGISRIELSDNASPFYSAVRAIVYVDDNQTLSRLTPVMAGNTLRLDGNLSAIAAQEPPVRQMAPIAGTPVALKPLAQPLPLSNSAPTGNWKPSRRARPLPPVTTPVPELKPAYGIVPPTAVAQENSVPAPSGSQTTIMGTPLLPDTNVVEGVSFREHRLMIQGRSGSELRIKNRFTLTAPKRLVLDVDNSVLASRSLLGSIPGDGDGIRQVRVGQFDQSTVRLVIETDMPEQFEAIFPGTDRSALAISPYSSTAITRLSSNTRLGEVESIDLKREAEGTLLRLTASTPIVHRFQKKDNRVTLELLNESAHPTSIAFDSKQYPEIEKMRLEPLTDGQPNSRLAITLDGRNIRAIPTLSNDGRVLEIRMSPGEQPDTVARAADNTPGGADDSGATVFMPAGKAPFPARIVLDAGHGGKDIGANRSGVYEKDLNLSLALLVRDALVAKGFKVYMTRSTDVFLPLPEISAITNRVHPDLFVSIHHNASVNPALNGIETYYYTPQSIALARKVHAREINAVGVRDGGVKQARFYVIHHTDVPAVLCEVGYVSNPSELDALQTMDRKLKTARSIADGVVDYLKSRVSASAK
jgi:N-acetylmuramoyl-L-alanine amidase